MPHSQIEHLKLKKILHPPLFFISDDDMDYLPKLGLEDFKGAGLKKTLRSCAAEVIGTLFLVLIGCGACLNHEKDFQKVLTNLLSWK